MNFPFADGTGSKVRPALVIQCDRNNDRLGNTILALITSRIREEPTQLLIKKSTDIGQKSGLVVDSTVSCENLYTISQDIIKRKLGLYLLKSCSR